MTNDLKKPTEDVALPADARRWRAICRRHGAAMTRLATGSSSYRSDKKQAALDAWADAAAAEVAAFDPEAWLREDVPARIAELERVAAQSACSTASDTPPPSAKPLSWGDRMAQIAQLRREAQEKLAEADLLAAELEAEQDAAYAALTEHRHG